MYADLNSTTPPEEKDEWRTEPVLFNLLDQEFNFQLDVAATDDNALCPVYFTKEQNALELPWADWFSAPPAIFCNPPFSQVGPFLLKGREEAAKGATCVFLVRADGLETVWWREGVLRKVYDHLYVPNYEIRFLSPRTNYYRPVVTKATGVRFPSVVIVMRSYTVLDPKVFWWNWKDNLVPKL